MTAAAASKALAASLFQAFEARGASRVETAILQPAGTLLDLYGEDIRARAYTTSDPLRGEQMLRPDFTVPVVQMHMDGGAEPARYCYMGEVFRRQEDDDARANEYMQVGYEAFDRDAAAADAEVYALFSGLLEPYDLTPVTGDIGLLTAAVKGLQTSDARKSALLRHIWRPRKFRALLDRFAKNTVVTDARASLLAQENPFDGAAPIIGKRTAAEITERLDRLRRELDTPPISAGEVTLLNTLLSLRETTSNALSQLQDLAVDMPALSDAVARFEARLDALAQAGIDPAHLPFEASFGRTSMEYYDGFVFGFSAASHPDWPAVASGGRYDALTEELGRIGETGRAIPAVGGVIRPGLLADLEAEA
ncbi:ATP phosphoribosyltransferase regulatory subunit [Nereida sp. MMG025]|uniref:ATP phosphoribosyltransferase regulatory subunit n=1 Tax=Nereida sp. MMG025 TaxID=2909981 RepID=UPI001F326896|nr:ATP phosphoribosyltransferase regulatory subunit [Nereida sp. MMG025]MCF6444131.1 ATP phosphoribosyltransferase regulatory subunit [Nereida sp. MMG025]